MALSLLYVVITLRFAKGLFGKDHSPSDRRPFVSIVIAARNEEAFLERCLESLTSQTYPPDRLEIIVVDDDSTDRTKEIIASFEAVTYLRPAAQFADYAAKKRPLATGIAAARGEIILTTDADCTVSPGWAETIVAEFNEDVSVVLGYSKLGDPGRGLLEQFQAFDFQALLSAAAGAAGTGTAWAATGQNFAYRKRLYSQVGGLSRIADRASGDDVLLLQLFRGAGAKAAFCFEPSAHVTTWRHESLLGLINQRKRWASNVSAQVRLNPLFFAHILGVFCAAILPITLLVSPNSFFLETLFLVGLRIFADVSVLLLAARRLRIPSHILFYPAWLLLQIPYVMVVGIGGILSGYDWKDRHHTTINRSVYPDHEQPDGNHVTM